MTRVFFCIACLLLLHYTAPHLRAEESKPKILLLLALSGEFAGPTKEVEDGIRAALHIHKKGGGSLPFELIYEDTKGDPKQAIAALQRYAGDQRVIAVVTQRSSVGIATSPITSQLKVANIGISAHPKFIDIPQSYRAWVPSFKEGSELALEMHRRKLSSVALISAHDDYALSVTGAFKVAFQKQGGSLAIDDTVLPSDNDLRALAQRVVKAKIPGVFAFLMPAQFGIFYNTLTELQYKGEIFGPFWVSSPECLTAIRSVVSPITFIEASIYQGAVAQALQDLNSTTRGGGLAAGVAATQYLLEAFRINPAISNRQDLLEALGQVRNLPLGDLIAPVTNREVELPMAARSITAK